jgi:hypothetical protein
MRSTCLLALVWIASVCGSAVAGPTAADYQIAIREATELYRGDLTRRDIVNWWEYVLIRDVIFGDYSSVQFPTDPFGSVSLHSATPNQTLQLTPSRTASTSHDD